LVGAGVAVLLLIASALLVASGICLVSLFVASDLLLLRLLQAAQVSGRKLPHIPGEVRCFRGFGVRVYPRIRC
jgi:hypothetical protein